MLGKVHDTKQQYDIEAHTLQELINLLPLESNPIQNWNGHGSNIKVTNIMTWFPSDDHVALYAPANKSEKAEEQLSLAQVERKTTYYELNEMINALPRYNSTVKADKDGNAKDSFVVAVLLPNDLMAETAVVLLSLMAQYNDGVCAAPLDPNMSYKHLQEAFLQLKCNGLITTKEIWNSLIERSVSKYQIESMFEAISLIEPDHGKTMAGAFSLSVVKGDSPKSQVANIEVVIDDTKSTGDVASSPEVQEEGKEQRPIILLRTSGTTSIPKIVPLTPMNLLYNSICIAQSLKLSRSDIDLNSMPLYHIGGIACALMAVLISGSSVIMNGAFNPQDFMERIMDNQDSCSSGSRSSTLSINQSVTPTWYYGVPTMHKSLILTIQCYLRSLPGKNKSIPNRLRFVRSGAAHLSHETAVELANILQVEVLPTYSMSECMPICSQTVPIFPSNSNKSKSEAVVDTVGIPIAPSLRIIDPETGIVLSYAGNNSAVGEVCLKGPGVIKSYLGQAVSETHTNDGWLRTGDMGYLDQEGRLFLKGRTKEMIKRGGEQIWPNEIDDVINAVDGVVTAVAFGVPNEIWGEEVAVAVVLDSADQRDPQDSDNIRTQIIQSCKENLAPAAIPMQIVFVENSELLKGPTGKYLRARMAEHLKISSVDVGALKALQGRMNAITPDAAVVATPSDALNGLRFIVAILVVQVHAGLMPYGAWAKMQGYSLNMIIFFAIGGLQLAASTSGDVLKSWSVFVGTKIGTMHALFLVSLVLGAISHLLFMCGQDGYYEKFTENSCNGRFLYENLIPEILVPAFLTPLTSIFPLYHLTAANPPIWFQSVFYSFLIIFPILHKYLRCRSIRTNTCLLILFIILSTFVQFPFFINGLFMYSFTIITWLPSLVASMLFGYRYVEKMKQQSSNSSDEASRNKINTTNNRFKVQTAIITDLLTIVLFIFEIIAMLSPPSCIGITTTDFIKMRPGAEIPVEEFPLASFITEMDDGKSYNYVKVCDVTYTEFKEFFHGDEKYFGITFGRYGNDFGSLLGFMRLATPVVLPWLYYLSFGNGITAKFLSNQVLLKLSPLAYPLYLLHGPILRFYWILTRGKEAQFWFGMDLAYPYPIHWYELLIIIIICTVIGWVLENTIVQWIMPITVRFGIAVTTYVSKICSYCCCCCVSKTTSSGVEQTDPGKQLASSSSYWQISDLVVSLTGATTVSRNTMLRELGLDSLGATALLSTLRASVPSAKKLTMRHLSNFDTVGDLVNFLDGSQSISLEEGAS